MLRRPDFSRLVITQCPALSIILDDPWLAARSMISFNDDLEANGKQFSTKFQPLPKSMPEACGYRSGGV
jgi:hypothetical protein